MTNVEFRKAQESLGWSNSRISEELGCSAETVSRYRTGKMVVPVLVERYLEYRLLMRRRLADLEGELR